MTDPYHGYLAAVAGILDAARRSDADERAAQDTARAEEAILDRTLAERRAATQREHQRLEEARRALQALSGPLPAPTNAALPESSDPVALASQILDRADAGFRGIRDDLGSVERERERVAALQGELDERRRAQEEEHRSAAAAARAEAAAGNRVLGAVAVAGGVGAFAAAAIGPSALAWGVAAGAAVIAAIVVMVRLTGMPGFMMRRRSRTRLDDPRDARPYRGKASTFTGLAVLALGLICAAAGGTAGGGVGFMTVLQGSVAVAMAGVLAIGLGSGSHEKGDGRP